MAQHAILVTDPGITKANAATELTGIANELARSMKASRLVTSGILVTPKSEDTAATLANTVAVALVPTAQGITTNIGTGSAVGPNTTTATITGILATSTLVKVLLSNDTTHAITDVTSHYTVTGANTVTSDENDSAGHIIVVWKDLA